MCLIIKPGKTLDIYIHIILLVGAAVSEQLEFQRVHINTVPEPVCVYGHKTLCHNLPSRYLIHAEQMDLLPLDTDGVSVVMCTVPDNIIFAPALTPEQK